MAFDAEVPRLELKGIYSSDHSGSELRDLHLQVNPSEIHAILGRDDDDLRNLCEILASQRSFSSGEVLWDGQPMGLKKGKIPQGYGIQVIEPYATVIPQMSVAENLILPSRSGVWWSFFRKRQLEKFAREVIEQSGVECPLYAKASQLGSSEGMVLTILRALQYEPKILVLRGSLDKLQSRHYEQMKAHLMDRVEEGLAILLITSRIEDVPQLADRVSILKKGALFQVQTKLGMDRISLLQLTYDRSEDAPSPMEGFYQLLKYHETILEKLPFSMLVIDSEGIVRLMNQQSKLLLGEQVMNGEIQTILGPMSDLLPSELIPLPAHQLQEYRKERVKIQMKGATHLMDFQRLPVTDGHRYMGFILCLIDVTDREQLEQRLALADNLSSLGLLGAGVAHEINNPLEVLYNYLSLLRNSLQNPPDIEALEHMGLELENIRDIVSQLLNFSQRNTSPHFERFDLDKLIRKTCRLVSYNPNLGQTSLHYAQSELPIWVMGRPSEIRQVIMNLIRNSLEACEMDNRIDISCQAVGAGVRFVFRDHGPGISIHPPEDIFLPFRSSKMGSRKNLGLGMSISYNIVKEHGGILQVRNCQSGCEFSFVLTEAERPN